MLPHHETLIRRIQKALHDLSGYAYAGPISIHTEERDSEIREHWSTGISATWELEKVLDDLNDEPEDRDCKKHPTL